MDREWTEEKKEVIMSKNYDRHLRMDEATALRLKEKSDECGLSEQEYMRRLISQSTYQLDRESLQKILRNISGMGNNVNQIAKKVNTTIEVTSEDLRIIDGFRAELYEMRKEVVKLLKELSR